MSNESAFPLSHWKLLLTQLLYCRQGPVAPEARFSNLATAHHHIWLIENGSVTLEGDKWGKMTVEKGQWVYMTPGLQKSHHFSEDAEILSISSTVRWDQGPALFIEDRPIVFAREKYPQLEVVARQVHQTLGKYSRQFTTLSDENLWRLPEYMKFQSVTAQWFYQWNQVLLSEGCAPMIMKHFSDRVHHCLKYISQHLPKNGSLPYDLMTKAVGLSRNQLDNVFKSETGLSPKVYYDKMMTDRALELLGSSDSMIKQVAYELGFVSSASFCNWFKRQMNCFPDEYRKWKAM